MEQATPSEEVTINVEDPDDNAANDDNAKNKKDQKKDISDKSDDSPNADKLKKKKLPYGRTYTVCMARLDEYYQDDPIYEAEPYDRSRFVRKTFAIVFILLLITALCTVGVRIEGTMVNDFFRTYGKIIAIGTSIGMIAMTYIFGCVEGARYPPLLYIMVFTMVTLLTLLTAAVTVRYKTDFILIAACATVIVVLIATGLSFTSFDFTRWYAVVGFALLAVFVASMILLVLSLALGMKFLIVHLILTIISTILLSVCLIIQLQMIMGGRSIEIQESQYLAAAFMVYSSIVYIFLNILQILGLTDALF